MKKINVLSLFGGIECWRVAMDRLGWEIGTYYSSEFDKYPRSQTEKNFPDIIHLGDVRGVKPDELEPIDILIGGSPCQDLSAAKSNGKGLEWEKSWLFYEYVRILKEAKPKYFLLENVASMKKVDRDKITEIMWVEPTLINSALVSAQNRRRLYWVWKLVGDTYEKVEVPQPEDRNIFLRDILEDISFDDPRWKELDEKYMERIKTSEIEKHRKLEKSHWLTASYGGAVWWNSIEKWQRTVVIWQFRRGSDLRIHADQENSPTLTANMGTGWNNVPIVIWNCWEDKWGNQGYKIYDINWKGATLMASAGWYAGSAGSLILWLAHRNRWEGKEPECNGTEKANSLTTVMSDSEVLAYEEPKYYWRKLTCIECERLQTLDDDFTKDLSNSRRYKAIGNGWNVETIKHIFSFIEF